MLDIEIVTDTNVEAIDIVSVAELGRHIRLTSTAIATPLWTGLLTDAITDTVAKLDGPGAELNRTIRPRSYRRFMSKFPKGWQAPIPLPFPPLLEVVSVRYDDGNSPIATVSASDYVVAKGKLVGEIVPKGFWPILEASPRQVEITFRAGYENDAYPPEFRRMVKFLASHYLENGEASVMEMNKTLIDRKVLFAMDDLRAALRVPLSMDDWGE